MRFREQLRNWATEQQRNVQVRGFERYQDGAASALSGAGLIPGVGQEVLHGSEQERAELALRAVDASQVAAGNQPRKELLCQVLRVGCAKAVPPYERVEWIPVGLAECFQRAARPRVIAVTRAENQAPTCCRELAVPRQNRAPAFMVGFHGRRLYGILPLLSRIADSSRLPCRRAIRRDAHEELWVDRFDHRQYAPRSKVGTKAQSGLICGTAWRFCRDK